MNTWYLEYIQHYYSLLFEIRSWCIIGTHRVIQHRLDLLGAIADMEEW